MIELEHLTKRYGRHVAVDDLDYRLEKGIIYGFLGPNGAGKSTTMNMITGYLAPTAGTVRINGYDIIHEPGKAKRCIGYLPEQPPLYQEMTTEEYLLFAAELKKVPGRRRKAQAEEAMELTKTVDVKKRLIRNLSKGCRQRVGLAQAILAKPEVIILDEPSAGLDPRQMLEIRALIRGLKERHMVILSSHNLSEVSEVCDHILILSEGRLAAGGTPQGLSGRMGEADSLKLTVKGKKTALEEVLQNTEHVRTFTVEEKPEVCTAVIEPEPQHDIREELFYRLADASLPILQMDQNRRSLEDIFLQLTQEEGDKPIDKKNAGGGAEGE